MNIDHNTLILITTFGGGGVLVLLELLMPGMIIVFFGVSAWVVGFLYWLGLVEAVESLLGVWIILSFLLVLVFRKLGMKLFPSDSAYQFVEEDVDTIGTVVTVVKTVSEDNNDGRISYSGTSWQATSSKGTIEEGKKARLLYRDNISWVVEPCSDDESQ